MERKEGEIFQYKGVRLLVCVDPSNSCTGCYFNKRTCRNVLKIRGECSYKKRKDKCSVTFEKIGYVSEENDKSILSEAEEIVNGSRQSDYGDPVESFERIAKTASMIAGRDLSPNECCAVLMAVKLVRESFAHKRDNLVDLCGYAYIMNEIKESNKKGEQDEKD